LILPVNSPYNEAVFILLWYKTVDDATNFLENKKISPGSIQPLPGEIFSFYAAEMEK
jgi:hypothetical protein